MTIEDQRPNQDQDRDDCHNYSECLMAACKSGSENVCPKTCAKYSPLTLTERLDHVGGGRCHSIFASLVEPDVQGIGGAPTEHKHRNRFDQSFVGRRFGTMVIGDELDPFGGNRRWHVECDCGAKSIRTLPAISRWVNGMQTPFCSNCRKRVWEAA